MNDVLLPPPPIGTWDQRPPAAQLEAIMLARMWYIAEMAERGRK